MRSGLASPSAGGQKWEGAQKPPMGLFPQTGEARRALGHQERERQSRTGTRAPGRRPQLVSKTAGRRGQPPDGDSKTPRDVWTFRSGTLGSAKRPRRTGGGGQRTVFTHNPCPIRLRNGARNPLSPRRDGPQWPLHAHSVEAFLRGEEGPSFHAFTVRLPLRPSSGQQSFGRDVPSLCNGPVAQCARSQIPSRRITEQTETAEPPLEKLHEEFFTNSPVRRSWGGGGAKQPGAKKLSMNLNKHKQRNHDNKSQPGKDRTNIRIAALLLAT